MSFEEQALLWLREKYPNHSFKGFMIEDIIAGIGREYRGGRRQFVSERYQ